MNEANMDLKVIESKIREYVFKAAEAILEIYDDESSFGIVDKADNSPLTKADLRSNEIICEGLRKITPDIAILSEENKMLSFDERKNLEYLWILDPLDGTKEFIKRNGEFTINLALTHHNNLVLGIVMIPVVMKYYYAIKGAGAFHDGRKLEVQKFSTKDKNVRIVASRSFMNDETKYIIEKFDNPEMRPSGSALKFLNIAEGKADFYPRMAPTMEWDTAAAQLVLTEAGGHVLDARTLTELRYNKENLLNPFFIAYGNMNEEINDLMN